jgi:hypothetical protein
MESDTEFFAGQLVIGIAIGKLPYLLQYLHT